METPKPEDDATGESDRETPENASGGSPTNIMNKWPIAPNTTNWLANYTGPKLPNLPNPGKEMASRLYKQYFTTAGKVNFDKGLTNTPILNWKSPVADTVPKILAPKFHQTWPRVSYSHLIPQIQIPKISLDFSSVIQALRETRPPNWPDCVDIDVMTEVIKGDGLPMVWVPPNAVLREVLDQSNRDARIKVLLRRRTDITAHCRTVLADVLDSSMEGQLPLAWRAIEAFESGHVEAAQPLAVLVTETVISREIGDYGTAKSRAQDFNVHTLPYSDVRIEGALAPIGLFYTSWYPSSTTPAPTELSRHVTVHQADASHYTEENSLISVMLMVSVLRTIQDLKNRNP